MRIGVVEYLNALPFRLGNTFISAIPSVLNQHLRAGALDVALTSSVECLDGPYRLLPGYGIAAYQAILSVNLYLKGELHGGRIGLTHHSATSKALLKVLCHHFWKVEPHFVPLSEDNLDGFLLIGDDALRQLTIPGYQTIDLATAWHEATGLPFVFALVAMREGVDYAGEEFEAALSWSETHHDHLLEVAHKKSDLPKSLLDRYYRLCHYRLGKQEYEGLQLFQQLRKNVSEIGSWLDPENVRNHCEKLRSSQYDLLLWHA